jgi:hypothetical protein
MITKVYYIDGTRENKQKMKEIRETIPCFYSSKPVEMDFLEVTIQMRIEDVAFVEMMIAPLV